MIALSSLSVTTKSPAQTEKPKVQKDAAQSLPALSTRIAFTNLQFDRPVAFAYPDDGGNLLFVVEQHTATIWSFPNQRQTRDKKLFLKLPDQIHRGNEEGLLGLAFHPKYKENKQFFVYYSANDSGRRHSVVSRFRASSDDPRRADPASEERIWVSEIDPFENHNGGTIAFGPDGYLYITLGDSGAADDPKSTGQNPKIVSARSYGSTSIIRRPEKPMEYRPIIPPVVRTVCEMGAGGVLHRTAKRLEVQLRPPDRCALGRRCRAEPLGNGPPDREWRQLRLEHPGRVPPVSAATPPAPQPRRQD